MGINILLPTDFSNNAWVAIEYALNLYKKEKCEFYILNVFNTIDPLLPNLLNVEPGTELYETAKEDSEEGLSKTLYKIIFKYADNALHKFNTLSVFNTITEAIKSSVEQKDIKLIVMGTKGITNARGKMLGSTANHVMEKVRECPVIVVPENGKNSLPKEIVFPTSYKDRYTEQALSYLIQIAKTCNSRIAILKIHKEETLDENQKENKRLLEVIVKGLRHSFHTLPKRPSHASLEAIVNLFVLSRNSDMIALIDKKHTVFESVFTAPFIKSLLSHSTVPMLVMHDLKT